MATNMLEKRTFPCEPATFEEISDILWYVAEGKDEHIAALRRSTYPIQLDQISWSELRFLGILGKEKNTCNTKLEKAGMDPGFYISCRGDALVLIHQDDAHIQRYVDLCGEKLESLEIHNTSLSTLNISSLANLRELYVVESKAFSSLEGLEQLTQLTCLNLCNCRQTPDLAAVAALPQLTKLLIQYCDTLINFPSLLELTQLKSLTLRGFSEPKILAHLGKLTQLTALDLSGCKNLTDLPGIENLTQLTTLEISQCKKLPDLPGLENLTQLTSLNLSGCSDLTVLPELENLTQLASLDLSRCSSLTALPGLENLTQLTSLNLSWCEKLTALPGLENLTQLTSLDLSWCEKLTTLPGLENLTQLTSLDLSRCKKLTALPELENLTQLTSLNLSWCEKLTALPGLENLTQLTSLGLSWCSSLSVLSGLENLTQLTSLNLSWCEKLTALSGLENMPQLTTLNLSFCSNLTALPGLENLTQLTSLNLSSCSNLTALPGLENLTQLTSLDFSWCRSLTGLSGLENLTQLTSLNFSSCSNLTALPGLENLIRLTSLNLSWCEKLTALSGLENMPQLTTLNLSFCSNLTALPGLENLTQLTTLDLSRCEKLTALPGLENLIQLTSLNLSGCSGLTDLSELENLTQLTSLNLSGCTKLTVLPESIYKLPVLRRLDLRHMHLLDLPDWFPEIAEQFSLEENDYWNLFPDHFHHLGGEKAIVYLAGTTVENVDIAVFQQPYEMVVRWFEERRHGNAVPLNEVKVVFLGDGEAGKTHTIARLLADGEKPADDSVDGKATPGIVIQDMDYTLDGKKIQVHYWDFGGQEILHSMHRMFLTERTLYVVIINARDDTQDDRARYWLHNIKSFAGTAPVLLVLNKIDQNPNASIDKPNLQKMYGGLKDVVRMSALEYSKAQFNAAFTDALLKQVQELGTLGTLWPQSWLKLKSGLENMETHYIHGNDYEDLCDDCGVEQNREELLHWFNDLGVSFCYGGSAKLEDYVILKPEWLTNAIYIILFNKCPDTENGVIPHEAIYRMLKKPRKGQDSIRRVLNNVFYRPEEAEYVLDVIRKFRLSYKIREDAEFIPVLCQRESMTVAEKYEEDPNALEFRMEFEYLPDNVIHRLMVEMRKDLDTRNVWRTGARFVQQDTGLSAVVRSEGEILRIFVRSDNSLHQPNTYLHILKGNIDQIIADMKLQKPYCEVIYKADGITEAFDYEDLLFALQDGCDTYRSKDRRRRVRNIPIRDILNQTGRTAEIELDKLRSDIITACMQLQGNSKFWDATEDEWNTAVRDALRNMNYLVNDQSFQGISGGEKKAGELDLDIRKDTRIPWTIYEALKITDKSRTAWNAHLEKLLDNYNPSGLNYLFLVTYVDCDKDSFQGIWDSFSEHIKWFDPGKYERLSSSFNHIHLATHNSPNYIRAARCTYDRAGSPTTVCHIFARMGR